MRRPSGPAVRRGEWVAFAVGLPIALLMLAPFLYMVATVLRGERDPLGHALTAAPFGRFFLNSAILSVAVAFGQGLTSTTAAYAFARLRFPGRDRLFVLYLSALLVPAVLLIVPRFLLISALGWVDTYQGLISTELGNGRCSGASCSRCRVPRSQRSSCWRWPTSGRVSSGHSWPPPPPKCRLWRWPWRACTACTT